MKGRIRVGRVRLLPWVYEASSQPLSISPLRILVRRAYEGPYVRPGPNLE